jgi:methyl-accepting chemotaxis protein
MVDIGIPGLTLPPWSLPKAPDFREAVVDQVKAIFSPAVKAALNIDIDIGIKEEVVALVNQMFDKLKTLLGDIAFVANELLSKTETLGKNLIAKISQELSSLVKEVQRAINDVLAGVRDNLINPFFARVDELRRILVEDIRGLIDKILSGLKDLADKILTEGDRILTGTINEFKAEVEKVVKFIPNPLDPCRIKYDLQFTLGNNLTIGDLYNLFECTMLRRLEIDDTVREIKTVYGDLQHRSWHLSCVARGSVPGVSGSSGLQDIAINSWIKYGQLYQLWNQFEDDMTPLTALETRIKQLEDEIESFRSKSTQLDDLSTAVQKAQGIASDAVSRADNAQGTANDAVNRANNAQSTANTAENLANSVDTRTKAISFNGSTTFISSPLTVTIPDASGLAKVPLTIEVGTFSTVANKTSSYYLVTRDIGSGKSFDFVVKAG